MNLNAYISLMGHTWQKETTADGVVLRKVGAGVAPELDAEIMDVRDTTYLLTLDADSLLLRDYCLRLVYFLESAGNERVAVTQTPYSSFRGAPTRIERVAGATTDLQHILHQGMTYYGATFWVGANAVIRKRALEDIVEVETTGPSRSGPTSRTEPSSRIPNPASISASTAGPGELSGTAQLQRHAPDSAPSWSSAGAGRTAAC